MCPKQKFYICKKCGNLIGIIKDEGVPMMCCGEEMTLLTPNTVDASLEKHLPDVTVAGDRVDIQIGSVPHPMEDAHHITFVYVETEKGGQRKCLASEKEPKSSFSFVDDKPIAVYAYCNLHGLWKTDITV